jgi:hypothetical protein
VIIEVEDFIKKLHDGEIAIAPKAQDLQMTQRIKGTLGVSSENLGTLADLLGKKIARYEAFKDGSTISFKMDAALELLDLIERARTLGVIVPQNLTKILEECQDENKELKETKDQLEKENLQLRQENEKLHRLVKNLGGEPTSTVENGDKDE